MRHRKAGRQLNRNSAHREAMFRNMAGSLIHHELIKTTVPKAKELRRVAEPLITLAKTDSVHHRRLAFARGTRRPSASCSPSWVRATRRVRVAICVSSSAASGPATLRPWPTSSWSIVPSSRKRMTTTSDRSAALCGVRQTHPGDQGRALPGLDRFCVGDRAFTAPRMPGVIRLRRRGR